MAMIDYGSVVKKNGTIIQKEMFMDMGKSIGFVLNEIPYSYERNKYDDDFNVIGREIVNTTMRINGEFFSYIGDKELLICIYKGTIVFISNNKIVKIQNDLWFDYSLPYRLQKLDFSVNGIDFKIKRLSKYKNRYKLRFYYKGDLYECLYGYGVDVRRDVWYDVTPKESRYLDEWFS